MKFRMKKGISLFLTLALALTLMPQSGNLVSAAEITEISEATGSLQNGEETEITGDTESTENAGGNGQTGANEISGQEATEKSENVEEDEGGEGGTSAAVEKQDPKEPNSGENEGTDQDSNESVKTEATESGAVKSEEAEPGDITTETTQAPSKEASGDVPSAGEPVQTTPEKVQPSAKEDSVQSTVPTAPDAVQTQSPAETDSVIAEGSAEGDGEEGISPMSLLPIPEVEATIELYGYSWEQLNQVSLETLLKRLQDGQGNRIEVPEDAQVAWTLDEEGNPLEDEYRVLERGSTVDLSGVAQRLNEGAAKAEVQMIIGNGKQLDNTATRYFVRIKILLGTTLQESVDFELYYDYDNSGRRSELYGSKSYRMYAAEGIEIPVTAVLWQDSVHTEGKSYYVNITSRLSQYKKTTEQRYEENLGSDWNYYENETYYRDSDYYRDIEVEVYPMKEFLKYLQDEDITALGGAVTEQILNQENMYQSGGVESLCTPPDSAAPGEADNLFCVVYRDTAENKVLAYQGLLFLVSNDFSELTGMIYTGEEEGAKQLQTTRSSGMRAQDGAPTWNQAWGALNVGAIPGTALLKCPEKIDSYALPVGYPVEGSYLYRMEEDERIEKVTLCGTADDWMQAEQGEDVTGKIFTDGIPISGTEEVALAVFFKDKTAVRQYLQLKNAGESITYYYYYSVSRDNEGGYREYVNGITEYAPELKMRDTGIPVTPIYYDCTSESGRPEESTQEYYLCMSLDRGRSDIRVDVYPMKDFLEGFNAEEKSFTAPGESITDQIGNCSKGYKGTYAVTSSDEDWENGDNLFCLVYTNAETGKLVAYHGILVTIRSAREEITSKAYLYEDGQMKVLSAGNPIVSRYTASYEIAAAGEAVAVERAYRANTGSVTVQIPWGYSLDREAYYLTLDGEREQIEQIVPGRYSTLEQAQEAGAEDITAQILQTGEEGAPYGYEVAQVPEGGLYVTVFYKDHTAVQFRVQVQESSVPIADASYSYQVFRKGEDGESIAVEGRFVYAPCELKNVNIPVTLVSYAVKDYQEGEDYSLRFGSDIALHYASQFQVEVYPMKEYLKYVRSAEQDGASLEGAITGQILNLNTGGYTGKYTAPDSENLENAENLFCIVYTNRTTGKIMACRGVLFVICEDREVEGDFYTYIDGRSVSLTEGPSSAEKTEMSDMSYSTVLNQEEAGKASPKYKTEANYGVEKREYTYTLSAGYPSEKEYYYALAADQRIAQVVTGSYDNPEQAAQAGAEDVTDKVLPGADGTPAPGYRAVYGSRDYTTFTIFFRDGTALQHNVRVAQSSGVLTETHEYTVYNKNGNEITAGKTEYEPWKGLEDLEIPVTKVSYYVAEDASWQQGDLCCLEMTSQLARQEKDIEVKVYPMGTILEALQSQGKIPADLEGDITAQILNLETAGGYQGNYADTGSVDPRKADNLFCMVYKNLKTGKIMGYHGVLFVICPAMPVVTGTLYAYEDGKMTSLDGDKTDAAPQSGSMVSYRLGQNGEGSAATNVSYTYLPERVSYTLPEGYYADGTYYYEISADNRIEKIVEGAYNSPEEAEGAEDITSVILPANKDKAPYGYKIQYNRDMDFTVFFKSGISHQYTVRVVAGSFPYENQQIIPQDRDPWFNVTGAAGYEKEQLYVAENREAVVLDTYYWYGYQTIFINDTGVDLSRLAPEFECADEDVGVYVRRKQVSGASVQDFSAGPVIYNVFVDNNLRNYQVSFVKKESGRAKLYVNGPGEREVFLTEYFENRHDILIANVGDRELTGLKVELLDASNIKLDDYWKVGGQGNDHLAVFDETASDSEYGELMNLAKIRLLPDGEGEIAGTLLITADGQEPVRIRLTGYAQNPKIITEGLDEAVKYVPYSNVVCTNNMYEWNKVRFSLVEGEDGSGALPEGLSLNSYTGEIYGTSLEEGEFPITVKADYSNSMFVPSYKEFVLRVKTNSNDNVYNATDESYELTTPIGEETAADSHDFLLKETGDQLFVSQGEMGEFVALWLNGVRLEEGIDYTKESGSTRITVASQTFANKVDQSGTNTLAAEFRQGSEESEQFRELRRTAQNFRVENPEEKPEEKPGDNTGNQPGTNPGPSEGNTGNQPGTGEGNTGNGSGGNGNNSGTDDDTDDTAGGSEETNSNAEDPEQNVVTLVVRMVNRDGNPLADLALEMHSTPQSVRTNQNGLAVFTGLEEGEHTLYVKDGTGNILASKPFVLRFGDTTSLSDSQVVMQKGSIGTLTVQFSDGELTFVNQQEGDIYRMVSPATGDPSRLALWILLAAVSLGACVGMYLYRRKKGALPLIPGAWNQWRKRKKE